MQRQAGTDRRLPGCVLHTALLVHQSTGGRSKWKNEVLRHTHMRLPSVRNSFVRNSNLLGVSFRFAQRFIVYQTQRM
jgi:hypothetical protein